MVLAALLGEAADAAVLTPQDFAYGMPVVATNLATAYRVTLPPDVYRTSVRADLGDVRVFNSRGETVPYAILRRSEPAPAAPAQALPLFPLRGDTRAAVNGLKLTLDAGDGAIQLQTAPRTAEQGPVLEYILDGRGLERPVASLQLHWPDGSADFSGRVHLAASDDFANWRIVVTSAAIANLHAAGQALVEDRVEVPAVRAKFWRLSWAGSPPPFALTSVEAVPASGPPPSNWSTLFVDGTPVPGRPGEYTFDIGARVPVERVNLVLPELNAVYAVLLSARAREQDAWSPVVRAGFYRLSTSDGETRNNPVPIGVRRDRYWQVRILGDGAHPTPLRLEVMWSPADIEFLAQGPPPYQLAYGSSAVSGAETDLAILPTAATISTAMVGTRAPLGGEARLTDSPVVYKRMLLWTVLIVAVIVLGSMAIRLSRQAPAV
jgi:hypothetical protein